MGLLDTILGGLFGLTGAKKDAAQSKEMFELQRLENAHNMRRARGWQKNDNAMTRRWGLQDARRVRKQSLHDSAMLRKQSLMDQSKYFQRTRRFAEEAGFNPLSVMGVMPNAQPAFGGGSMAAGGGGAGAMSGSVGTPVLGNAYANAAMMLGQGLGQSIDLAAENEALSQKNAELNKAMETITLRPKIDGIYADRESFVSRAAATGGGYDTRQVVGSGAPDGGAAPASGGDPLRFFGGDFHTSDDFSDAQDSEDRYGEIVGAASGYWKAMRDSGAMIGEKLIKPGAEAVAPRWGGYISTARDWWNDDLQYQREERARQSRKPKKNPKLWSAYTPMGYEMPW